MPQDTYRPESSGNRSEPLEYVYNPKTGTMTSNPSSKDSTTGNKNVPAPATTTESASKVDSKTKAEKEFIEIEYNTLTGDMILKISKKTIKIKVNDTISIQGIGKYLSGLYYVESIRRQIYKTSGYSHSLTVIKTGFGDSMKSSSTAVSVPITETNVARPEEVKPISPPKLKVGDSVKIVGANAVYSNADDGVRVPDWVKTKVLTIDAVSKDETRVRLQPIWSWTYTKFIQRV
jgi:hypothetical protein